MGPRRPIDYAVASGRATGVGSGRKFGRDGMRFLAGVALAALISTSALAQTPPAGPSFTLPSDWNRKADGPVQILQPPEADTRLAIVEVGAAADAKAAA